MAYNPDTADIVRLILQGSANVESIIRANSLDQLTAPAANVSWNSKRITNLAQGILATDVPDISQLAGLDTAFVVSGCVWTADSPGTTRNGSMTAGTVMIKGILLTVASISGHTFTASSDTYIDLSDNGDGTAAVTFTTVANNVTSPALASSGTLFTTCRIAVVVTTSTAITSTAASICQGGPFVTATAQATSTVAAGSNGNNITTATLSIAANSMATAGFAVVDTSAGTGAGNGSLISYTSGGGTTTLSGITVLSGSGTVATGGVVTQATPFSVADMLGNPIFPTLRRPVLIARRVGATLIATSTASQPQAGTTVPFIVPAGPARLVRIWCQCSYVQSSAAAGTAIVANTQYATPGGSFTTVGQQQYKVQVASDGNPMRPDDVVQLAAGSYVANLVVSQGAAGTITVLTPQIGVELL